MSFHSYQHSAQMMLILVQVLAGSLILPKLAAAVAINKRDCRLLSLDCWWDSGRNVPAVFRELHASGEDESRADPMINLNGFVNCDGISSNSGMAGYCVGHTAGEQCDYVAVAYTRADNECGAGILWGVSDTSAPKPHCECKALDVATGATKTFKSNFGA